MDANTPKPHPPVVPREDEMPESLAQFVDEIMNEYVAARKPFVPKPHLTQRPFLKLASIRNSMSRK